MQRYKVYHTALKIDTVIVFFHTPSLSCELCINESNYNDIPRMLRAVVSNQ